MGGSAPNKVYCAVARQREGSKVYDRFVSMWTDYMRSRRERVVGSGFRCQRTTDHMLCVARQVACLVTLSADKIAEGFEDYD